MPRIAYVNGRYLPHADASVHIEDRGFQFADGVYEVVAFMGGAFVDERGHLDRLERSLSELKISMPAPRRVLMLVMREMARRNRLRDGLFYIQVTRGVAPRDFKFPLGAKPTLVMTMRPADFDMAARKKMLRKAASVPDIRWKRRDIKSTALLAQVLAKQAAVNRGAYEALMIDDDGFVTEGSSTNAWIVNNKGVLVTRPSRGNMILKGVTMNALQALCKKNGIKIDLRPFTIKEAHAAREVFTTAAVSLITPIVEIDGKKIGNGKLGDVTEKIMDIYTDYAPTDIKHQFTWEAA